MTRTRKIGLLLLLVVCLVAIGAGVRLLVPYLPKTDNTPVKPPARATPVHVAKARKGDLKVYFSAPGSVTALNTILVRSRIDGEVVNVAFTEGQMVTEGQLLFEIDPRPFKIQLEQAKGQLQKDEAALKNAKVDYERYRIAENAISEQILATQATTIAQLEGTLKTDQAAVESAELQITYCKITAPITGLIGLRNVDKGNFVRASDTSAQGLAVITQLQPIAVIFSLPQREFAAITTRVMAHVQFPVEILDRERKTKIADGELFAFDSQIDATTGTIRLKATFKNTNGALFPSQFVNARLLVETRKGQVLVPTAAVQRSPKSTFVYVVKPDDTVVLREVTPGPSEADETAIEAGLTGNEVVVIDNVDKLQSGAKVIAVPEKGDKKAQGGRAGDRPIPAGRYFTPNVLLTSQTGQKFHFYDDLVRDKIVVLSFFYATCQGVCPQGFETLRNVKRILGPRVGTDIFFYSITVDPDHDTPEILNQYAAENSLGPGWLLLTGSRQDIATITDLIDVTMMAPEQKPSHTGAVIYGNDRYDRWGACHATGDNAAETIAEAISWILPGREKLAATAPCANIPLK